MFASILMASGGLAQGNTADDGALHEFRPVFGAACGPGCRQVDQGWRGCIPGAQVLISVPFCGDLLQSACNQMRFRSVARVFAVFYR